MTTKSKPTLQDVARLAGVSGMTVSRALTKPDKVSDQTRQRIEQAVRELGYVPNLAASQLVTRRSGIIGALITTITNPILATTIETLQQGLARAGFHLLIGETRFSQEEEGKLLRAFLGRQLDGLILAYGYHSVETLELLQGTDIPLIELWDLPEGDAPREPVGQVVGFSNWAAGAAAGRHLVDCGYRRPAFFGYDDERENLRFAGFREAVMAGLGVEPLRLNTSPVPHIDDGVDVVQRIARGEIDCDGAFFTNDMPAIGALFTCQRLGLSVPGQLGICGFGDLPIARVATPSLTSVRIPAEQVANATVDLLCQRIRGEGEAHAQVDVGCELIARESTALNR
ncbi:LacI family DNA-binding transcriptional regulator [Metapseudomonas furukawaii]|uniref:Possible L-talarate utilization transcriptional regulator n=1 Tax=Metapseudomonas furukawaii TaxID=1149133 RepID=A0AAD1BZP7_METFU|nr:LacI family DNA-binding transcriptional regulator [Pseudomonas furukawaii]ELS25252.1 putative DNA-binding, LacI family, regulator [Pseudomonas furukawaii]BAU74611.1 possible L-talarate utilization transcriptional regulator [Pseudomonas furukawaii]